MNEQQYSEMRKKVQGLEFKLQDFSDDKSHPTYRDFEQRLRSLEDDLQTKKNPRSMEDKIQKLEEDFLNLNNTEVMSAGHVEFFAREMTQLKMNLRNFDNY